MSDYSVRIARLQQEMRAEGASGALLAGTDQMRYLTGWREGGHERFVGLFVPAAGDPAFLVPAMNAEQARHTPAEIEHVVGWSDSTGWLDAARELLAGWSSVNSSTTSCLASTCWRCSRRFRTRDSRPPET
jgi:Xaa-Pro aminopeptidase